LQTFYNELAIAFLLSFAAFVVTAVYAFILFGIAVTVGSAVLGVTPDEAAVFVLNAFLDLKVCAFAFSLSALIFTFIIAGIVASVIAGIVASVIAGIVASVIAGIAASVIAAFSDAFLLACVTNLIIRA
jgi:hypothetical protein